MKNIGKSISAVIVSLVLAVTCIAAEENSDQCETGIVGAAGTVSTTGISSNSATLFKGSSSGTATPLPVGAPKFNIWRSIGAMLLVIGLLLAINSYVTRKRGVILSMRNKNKRIVVLERIAVDHRRSLLLVEADGQRIVLGLGPDRMETIAVLTGQAPEKNSTDEHDTRKADVSFADSLKVLMGKDKS